MLFSCFRFQSLILILYRIVTCIDPSLWAKLSATETEDVADFEEEPVLDLYQDLPP